MTKQLFIGLIVTLFGTCTQVFGQLPDEDDLDGSTWSFPFSGTNSGQFGTITTNLVSETSEGDWKVTGTDKHNLTRFSGTFNPATRVLSGDIFDVDGKELTNSSINLVLMRRAILDDVHDYFYKKHLFLIGTGYIDDTSEQDNDAYLHFWAPQETPGGNNPFIGREYKGGQIYMFHFGDNHYPSEFKYIYWITQGFIGKETEGFVGKPTKWRVAGIDEAFRTIMDGFFKLKGATK